MRDIVSELWQSWSARYGPRKVKKQFAQLPDGCPYRYSRKILRANGTVSVINLPCGKCSYCRIMNWSVAIGRSIAETTCHDASVAWTLTLSDQAVEKMAPRIIERHRDKPFPLTVNDVSRVLMLRDGLDPYEIVTQPDTVHGNWADWDAHNDRAQEYRDRARLELSENPGRMADEIFSGQSDPLELWRYPSVWRWQKELLFHRLRETHMVGYAPRYEVVYEQGEESHRPHAHMMLYGVPPEFMPPRKLLWAEPIANRIWPHGGIVHDKVTVAAARYIAGYTHDPAKRLLKIGSGRSPGIGDAAIEEYFQFLLDYRSGKVPRRITIEEYPEKSGRLARPVFQYEHRKYPLSKKHIERGRELGVISAKPLSVLELETIEDNMNTTPESRLAEERRYRTQKKLVDLSVKKRHTVTMPNGTQVKL